MHESYQVLRRFLQGGPDWGAALKKVSNQVDTDPRDNRPGAWFHRMHIEFHRENLVALRAKIRDGAARMSDV